MTREQITSLIVNDKMIEAAAYQQIENSDVSVTSYQVAVDNFINGALWMQSAMEAQKEQWQREAFCASREGTVVVMSSDNTHPIFYQKYETFEDWKK